MTTLETLKAARKLLEPRGAWCKKALAQDRSGNAVEINDPAAVKFCMDVALGRVQGDNLGGTGEAYKCLFSVNNSIVRFNDRAKSKYQVLAAFDEAIARLEAK